ncbi:MAG: helix-turn-helix domain-containing protein [Candidatus Hydrogenedentes bacterium]|nr:helix-turn-helix domain-containing protein [Candidatus Hydrogenedentota bacterium]
MTIPGVILKNPRGVKKSGVSWKGLTGEADENAEAVCWNAKYGSITFNSIARDFPLFGLNENGLLVVELSGAGKNPTILGRPHLFWSLYIQYCLDNFGSARRRSTEVVAVEDRQVAMALRHIRDHACGEISIADLLKVVHLSRATLHRRFRAALGRSPKAEILRVRLEQSRRLLVETDLTLTEVARRVGFASPEHFCYLFKAKLGQTPGKFRANARASIGTRLDRPTGRRRTPRDKDVSK